MKRKLTDAEVRELLRGTSDAPRHGIQHDTPDDMQRDIALRVGDIGTHDDE
jgi:hypothetical protein